MTATRYQDEDCKLAFNQMGKFSHLDTYETLESLLRCFPSDIRDKWIKLRGKLKSKNAAPDFSHLIELVVEKANGSSNVYNHLSSILDRPTNIKRNESTNPNSGVFLTSVISNVSKIMCPKCLKAHQLHDCPKFRDMPPKQRLEYVKLKGRYFSCLKGNHTLRECRIKRNCSDYCRKLHRPLLHDGLISDNSEVVKPTVAVFTTCNWNVLLGVIPVKIQSTHGFEITYALLDPGSQITLMKSSMARRLNLRGREIELIINTAVGSSPIENEEISFMLNSLDGKGSIEIPNAYLITALPFDNAPEFPVGSLDRWDHLKVIHLPHAPNKEITMHISSDIPETHWVIDQRIGKKREPFATLSILGWVLRGPFRENVNMNFQVNCMTTTQSIESMLNRMYNQEFEEFRCTDPVSQDDMKAVRLVNSSIKYANGHHTIGLLGRSTLKYYLIIRA